MKKFLFITIGVLSVILGIIGIFVPGLPTTPFILLSSWLFYKSSKRLHDRLHRSPLGKYAPPLPNQSLSMILQAQHSRTSASEWQSLKN